MAIVYPTSCGFVKVFIYHLFTKNPTPKRNQQKTPNNIVGTYYVIILLDLHPSFTISNQVMTIQSLNSTFERL